jgi:hypothetical protein
MSPQGCTYLVRSIIVILVRHFKPGTEDRWGAVDQHGQLLLRALGLVAAVAGWQYRQQYKRQYRRQRYERQRYRWQYRRQGIRIKAWCRVVAELPRYLLTTNGPRSRCTGGIICACPNFGLNTAS